jgi:hypothetical protein
MTELPKAFAPSVTIDKNKNGKEAEFSFTHGLQMLA